MFKVVSYFAELLEELQKVATSAGLQRDRRFDGPDLTTVFVNTVSLFDLLMNELLEIGVDFSVFLL